LKVTKVTSGQLLIIRHLLLVAGVKLCQPAFPVDLYVFYRHGVFLFMRIICGPDETHFIASGLFCIMTRQNVTIFSVSCCRIPAVSAPRHVTRAFVIHNVTQKRNDA